MLDPDLIRESPEIVRKAIADKRTGDPAIVDEILAQDTAWRDSLTRLQQARTRSNELARRIGELMRTGKKDEAQTVISENGQLKSALKGLEAEVREMESVLSLSLLELPNVPHESVPVGIGADDNRVVFEEGDFAERDFAMRPHWELIAESGIVDFDRGSKVSGAGFPFYIGPAARLQRALVSFFLDTAVSRGYTEVQAPLVVNADSATGTGQLPDKEDQMYTVDRDGLYLIPTSEVPLTNYHRDEILDGSKLPLKYAAYTPCFRREAGSYGKDVRGLNRLHQFDKVELVQFVRPEVSYEALEDLVRDAELLIRALELPYRKLLMCTGDMGFTQAKKYDLEVYSAGQGRWLEVSSVSNFEAFQARRMKIRYRDSDGSPQLVHTLNGSGLALPRTVAALIENGQQSDGTIRLPDALTPYYGDAILSTQAGASVR